MSTHDITNGTARSEHCYGQDTQQVPGLTFKSAAGTFSTGVVIVTALDGDKPVGVTLQSFTSLSFDPQLISIALARTSATLPQIRRAGHFCVNILSHQQRDLATQFSKSAHSTDKFANVDFMQPAPGRSPIFAGSLAWIECTVEKAIPAGDHAIVIGTVWQASINPDPGLLPLTFWRSSFRQ